MTTKPSGTNTPHPLPCVVQVGFAGTRKLFDEAAEDSQRAVWSAEVEAKLVEVLATLPAKLQLHANHFLVGISQIACGADTLFSRACLQAKPQPIPHRVMLPESRDAYLSAVGSDGPDFTPNERAEAEELLAGPHIIQEQVVSQSVDRSERFVDTNAHILRISDVIICLITESSRPKPGGTNELLERAKQRGTPVLEIHVTTNEGMLVFTEQWPKPEELVLPYLPSELADESVRIATEPLPPSNDYCKPLKKFVSTQAKWHQKLFKFAAAAIIATHTSATICAAFTVAFHGIVEHFVLPIMLGIELVLLAVGYLTALCKNEIGHLLGVSGLGFSVCCG